MQDSADREFYLTFTDLLLLLRKLEMGSDASIASRFRKLRPKFASDQMLSKPGSRIQYDLARVLAICAVFMVNSISVPQADAVSIVVPNWPEIARGFLAAHQSLQEKRDAGGSSSTVTLYVDAFPVENTVGGAWANAAADLTFTGIPFIVLDCYGIVAALHSLRPGDRSLSGAFQDLDRTFGSDKLEQTEPTRLPTRPESGFFGTGPYFDRARALISVTDVSFLHVRERLRLQAYLDYLEAPPPIDAWKQFISSDAEEEGLGSLLSVRGFELGLRSRLITSHLLASRASPASERALDLITRGERRLAQIVEEARS